MKKIHNTAIFLCAILACVSSASAKSFTSEIKRGLDTVGTEYKDVPETQYTQRTVDTTVYGTGYGALGQEVFYDVPIRQDTDYEMFIPTTMYVRGGVGMNLGVATKKARIADETFRSKASWNVLIGLGWNMSSYVRTELAYQESTFKFKDVPKLHAEYHTLNGMLYFDFMRRYVESGDITYRRSFSPFFGIGAGIGAYEFSGPSGADGMVVVAPRAELGMNFMLNDVIGIDIAYQYQMMWGHGFGWNTKRSGVDSIGNIMATLRANF